MFPHMYKVRPGKSQQVKEPEMAADCQWQRGENWRRNSGKWGSQGWDANSSPSSGTPSVLQGPPPIPAPPVDPQDNLARRTSLTQKEPEQQKPLVKLRKVSAAENKTPEVAKPNLQPQKLPTKLPPKPTPPKDVELPKFQKPDAPSTSAPPPPPPPPPAPKLPPGCHRPPAPRPPGPLTEKDLKIKKKREQMVDQIKKASRSRPDWHSVMKDIEGGIKLRKVSSSDKLDRSQPILPTSKGKEGKFIYESEKPIGQNMLLGEIHKGVKLRHVRTDDRSRPDFIKLGLRKLRRQRTVEEMKRLDPDGMEALPSSSDEEEDIDRMRDDLSATKAQLADEIKKGKKLETEHKILKIDYESLKSEVRKLRRKLKEAGVHEVKPLANGEANAIAPKLSKSMSKLRMMEDEVDFSELDVIEEDIKLLNDQIEAQRKRAEKAEQKCEELSQKMEVATSSADEWEMRSLYFEKKYKNMQKDQGIDLPDIDCIGIQTDPVEVGPLKSESTSGIYARRSSSKKSISSSLSRMQSFREEDESDESSSSEEEDTLSDNADEDESEGEEEEGEVIRIVEDDNQNKAHQEVTEADRDEKDFIMWTNKLSHMKDKVKNVRKERNNLRERIKKYYREMRIEREQYLKLKDELEELLESVKDPEESKNINSDGESDSADERNSEDSDDEDNFSARIKRQVRTKKKSKASQETDEDEEEEICDLSDLQDPEWPESEQEESGSDDEGDEPAQRVKGLKERTKRYEENMNEKKKETYLLKAELEQFDERLADEKRRHARLENELHILLADL